MANNKAEIAKKLMKIAGKNFNEKKHVEGKVGGKTISGGIKGGLCKLNKGCKFDISEKSGVPFAIIAGSCVEPSEDAGARVSVLYYFNNSQYSSAEEEFGKLLNDLVVLGCDVSGCDSPADCIDLLDDLAKGTVVEFNTGTRANKNGEYRVFWQGLAEDQDAAPPNDVDDNTAAADDGDFQPGDSVTVNDPNDADSPWEGEVDNVDGDTIHCIYEGEVYPVAREYVTKN